MHYDRGDHATTMDVTMIAGMQLLMGRTNTSFTSVLVHVDEANTERCRPTDLRCETDDEYKGIRAQEWVLKLVAETSDVFATGSCAQCAENHSSHD